MGTHSDTATRAAAKKITTPARQSPLTGSVGVGGDNNPADVRLVSDALAANNRLTSPSDHNSLDLEAKITTLQQDMGGLKADGLINPGGPTERRFADLASGGWMKPPSLPGAATPKISDGTFAHSAALTSNPSDEKDGTPAKAWARIQQKKRTQARTEATRAKEAEAEERRAAKKRTETAKTLVEHRKQMAAARQPKKTPTRWPLLPKGEGHDEGQSLPPALSDDAISSNARAARYLAGRTGIGDYPRFVADGIAHDGDKAIAEAVDLYNQTKDRNPKQADALLNRVTDELSPDHQDALNRALDGSPDRPTAKTPTMRDKLYRPDEHDAEPVRPEPYYPGRDRNQNRILLADTKQGRENDDNQQPVAKGIGPADYPDADNLGSRRTRVEMEMPKYVSPEQRPRSDDGIINDYVHRMGIEPKLAERVKPEDIETLRKLERFRQLDRAGTEDLQDRLRDLRSRDPELFEDLNAKRASALANPGWELWSLSDREIRDAIERIEVWEGAGETVSAANSLHQAYKSPRVSLPGILLNRDDVKAAMGDIHADERIIDRYRRELSRRQNWKDRR